MTAPPFALRPAAAGDREFLFRVYASTRAEELAPVPWTAVQKEQFLRQQFGAQDQYYQQVFAGGEFGVLESAGEGIGRLYVWRDAGEIRIIDIALLPAWRGRGIGRSIIGSLQDEAAAQKKSLTIHVEENNPAQRLYLRLGFEKVSLNGLYWLLRWRPAAQKLAPSAGVI